MQTGEMKEEIHPKEEKKKRENKEQRTVGQINALKWLF